jgi:hypothetical protein
VNPTNEKEPPSTLQKALTINLDQAIYGTIAEIGAGQEVARFFFQAGGAAGTIAKSMSAYDMQFSNAIYGAEESGRYVTRGRLERMLDREYRLVVERLEGYRPKNTTYFAFANTVAAKAYNRKGECHGWLGVRMQLFPEAPPSQVMLHVRMLDKENRLQQDALGILGVNLIYGAFYHYRSAHRLIESLLDNLSTDRIEIDMIEFSGPYFDELDHRLINLHLIKTGLTNAVMYAADGTIIQPSEILHKKHILVIRGSFRPVTNINLDMIKCGYQQFLKEPGVDPEQVVMLTEITTATLEWSGDIDDKDFLGRVDTLNALGQIVLISNYLRYFRLVNYFRRYTQRTIGIVLGIPNVRDIFNEKFYEGLEGGILEAFGKLFGGNTKLFVYPATGADGQLTTLQSLQMDEKLRHLFDYLLVNEYLVPMDGYRTDLFHIDSRAMLKTLQAGRDGWQKDVPEIVAQMIESKRLFGYDSV